GKRCRRTSLQRSIGQPDCGASSVDGATGKFSGAGNVIAANSNARIVSQTASGNLVQGNFIGTNVFGTAALANATSRNSLGGGIAILTGASAHTIGGTSTLDGTGHLSGLGNLISGNAPDAGFFNTFSRSLVVY